ncbi:MAG: acyl carrier protein, partial [Gemmatimonadota bacterium]
MDPEQIRKAVLATIELIAPETDVQTIRPDRPLRQQIDLDSVDWLNFIAGLHERLSVDIPDADIERLATLDALVAYLASRPAQATLEPPRAETPSPLPSLQHAINGTMVTVRQVRPDDIALEADFVRHLSADARYQRFMSTLRELPEKKLHYLTEVDQVRHVALAATVDRDGREVLVGVVRYIVDPAGTGCEFA